MYLKNSSSYVTGLTHMASYVSKSVDPSFVIADCFETNDYVKDFAFIYDISEEMIKITESELSIEEILKMWFGDENSLVQGLLYWIGFKAGKPKRVYELSNNEKVCDILSYSSGGKSPFYTLEELYFIEFEKMTICFLIGNNE